jgi:hypothetical protein
VRRRVTEALPRRAGSGGSGCPRQPCRGTGRRRWYRRQGRSRAWRGPAPRPGCRRTRRRRDGPTGGRGSPRRPARRPPRWRGPGPSGGGRAVGEVARADAGGADHFAVPFEGGGHALGRLGGVNHRPGEGAVGGPGPGEGPLHQLEVRGERMVGVEVRGAPGADHQTGGVGLPRSGALPGGGLTPSLPSSLGGEGKGLHGNRGRALRSGRVLSPWQGEGQGGSAGRQGGGAGRIGGAGGRDWVARLRRQEARGERVAGVEV